MIRQKIGQSIFAVSNKLRRIIDKEHQEYSISGGQSRVLNFIFRQSRYGDVFQKNIESFFSIRSSSATELVKKLVEDKLIKRTTSTKDKRMKKLILTDEGLAVVKKTFNILDKIENEYKLKVKEEDYELFIQLLHLFEETLDEREHSYV